MLCTQIPLANAILLLHCSILTALPQSIPSLGNLEDAGDDYKLENNVRISDSRSALGKKVSRLQVAEVVAASIDISASSNKVLPFRGCRKCI